MKTPTENHNDYIIIISHDHLHEKITIYLINSNFERTTYISASMYFPSGENLCPGEQRIAVAIGPAAQGDKPVELCGLAVV